MNEKGRFARHLVSAREEETASSVAHLNSSHLSDEQLRAKEFIKTHIKAVKNDRVGVATRGRGNERGAGDRGSWREGERSGKEEWSEGRTWKGGVRSSKQDRKGLGQQAPGGEGQRSPHAQKEQRHGQHNEATPSSSRAEGHGHSVQPRTRPEAVEGVSSSSEPKEPNSVGVTKGQQGPRAKGDSAHNDKRARQLKDKNKSSRANHSRKAGADKKRRGGMM